jgi:TRAP-type transport system small permease protein
MRRLVAHLDDAINILLLAAVVAVLSAQVFFRYVLNYSLGWTSEAATILFAWLIFLGAPAMLKRQSHMGVWFFRSASEQVQRGIRITIELLSLIFYAAVLIGGIELTRIGSFSVTPAMAISRAIVFVVVPIAAVLLVARTAIRIWQLFRGTSSAWLEHGKVD